MVKGLTASSGRVWVQPGGANQEMFLLGCYEMDDLTEDMGGAEPIYCRDAENQFVTKGESVSPPDLVSSTLTGLTFPERDALDKLEGKFALYALERDGGLADVLLNYQRGQLLANARKSQRSFAGIASGREDDSATELSFDIEAWPPLWDIDALDAQAISIAGILDGYCVVSNTHRIDPGGELSSIERGESVGIGMEAGAGVTAEFFTSAEFGANSAATGADPFVAIDEGIRSALRLLIGKETVRWLVAVDAIDVAAGQGMISYSDDGGATWTEVTIGGAAAGHGAAHGKSLYAVNSNNIFLATAAGYIYRSQDYGATWAAVEEGVIHAGDNYQMDFSDELNGMTVGDADVISLTEDGGLTWFAATATGGGNGLLCCQRLSKQVMWIGDDGGQLWWSEDGGDSWTERTGWTGSGVGTVQNIEFLNDFMALMVSNTAAPIGTVLRSFNGGRDWEALNTPTNLGILDLSYIHQRLAYIAGNTTAAATSLLGKVFA